MTPLKVNSIIDSSKCAPADEMPAKAPLGLSIWPTFQLGQASQWKIFALKRTTSGKIDEKTSSFLVQLAKWAAALDRFSFCVFVPARLK